MQSLTNICKETGLSIDDIHLILSDIREDWATTETVTDAEANLIRQSTTAALPEGNSQITPIADMPIDQQRRLIDNASQVLGSPLVLAAMQEIKMIDALHEVKNAVILNTIDRKQSELETAIKERESQRQLEYMTVLQDLANSIERPITAAQEMTADIKAQNEQLEAILKAVRAGK